MAERMIKKNYGVMVEALYNFGAKTSDIANEIQDAANACRNALGEEDTSIAAIYQSVNRCRDAYQEVAREALRIARDMGEELQRADEEAHLWSEED